MIPFAESKSAYEAWLAKQLGDELVATDLAAKSDAMRASGFVFLRATYWRWAEIIPEICPDLMSAPQVLAVGDIHLENYGTWRDRDGRLVWGVNDFDEAAEMPYALDLVRLSTSAALAMPPTRGSVRRRARRSSKAMPTASRTQARSCSTRPSGLGCAK